MEWKMLKKRIIPILLLKNGRMVKGKNFTNYRDTGDPVSQAKIYNTHNTDELVFLDTEATLSKNDNLLKLIKEVSKECFMPLSVGGGISSIDDIKKLINVGADKVVINSNAINNFNLIDKASKLFGKQAIIISIDVKKENDKYIIYTNSGNKKEKIDLSEHIKMIQLAGAGELLINSIDKDGMMDGYDIDLLNLVNKICSIPVIICGGAGNFEHLYEGFIHKAHAVACSSLFHFGDNNPTRARSYLLNKGIAMKNIKGIKF
jgi:cyclase